MSLGRRPNVKKSTISKIVELKFQFPLFQLLCKFLPQITFVLIIYERGQGLKTRRIFVSRLGIDGGVRSCFTPSSF